jgi:aspartyl-tRNA(Asn)/glutamyl-tRNA(Gln) amidotransferase subunit A
MSVPCGRTSEGLPVGLQILCRHFDEEKMFRLADAFERLR